jgi:hypothetical protein
VRRLAPSTATESAPSPLLEAEWSISPSGPSTPAQLKPLKQLTFDLAGTFEAVGDALNPKTWSTHPVR